MRNEKKRKKRNLFQDDIRADGTGISTDGSFVPADGSVSSDGSLVSAETEDEDEDEKKKKNIKMN